MKGLFAPNDHFGGGKTSQAMRILHCAGGLPHCNALLKNPTRAAMIRSDFESNNAGGVEARRNRDRGTIRAADHQARTAAVGST
jgi:hypothetical protein